jgi:hypothetical protein
VQIAPAIWPATFGVAVVLLLRGILQKRKSNKMEETISRKEDSPSLMAPGAILTSLAVLILATTLFFILSGPLVDFPCESALGPGPVVTENTRIAYCISLWPRFAHGGYVYAYGAPDENIVVVSPQVFWYDSLTLERKGQDLIANGQLLHPGDTYTHFRWFPSINPWLILTARLTVKNSGTYSTDTLYVDGGIDEGCLPGPLGFIILGIGIWLLFRGAKERQSAQPCHIRQEAQQ